jgi:hypothetical protein
MELNCEKNWKSKTLECLEGSIWGDPEYESQLVLTCHSLRKKQLKDFDIEDLRIMIGQNIGLRFLMPLAIDRLKENILAEGDYYEGDLLSAVLQSNQSYWKVECENWSIVLNIFNANIAALKSADTTEQIKDEWFAGFLNFSAINHVGK